MPRARDTRPTLAAIRSQYEHAPVIEVADVPSTPLGRMRS